MSGNIVIKNATIFTGHDVVPDGTVVIRNSLISHVGGEGAAPGEKDDVIDAGGRLVTPGFTIGHTHIYSALARGILLKGKPARNFVEILESLWWLLDRNLTLGQIELSAFLCGMDCLRSGVTTLFDHHASFGAVRGSLGVIAEALMKVGLRGCLCFEVSDREGEKAAREAIEENVDFIRRARSGKMELIRAMFGLHASFTVSQQTLKKCADSSDADEVGFHIHVAEDREDQTVTVREYGKRVVRRLFDEGILGKKTICSHCIWLEDEEVDLLAGTGATAVYNPQSNMNNAVGAPGLKRMKERGVGVVLGTDGFTANIFREALAGQILQNHVEKDPAAGWNYLPEMVLKSNNRLLRKFFGFGNELIEKGGRCDVVLWNYKPPTPLKVDNFWGHAVFGLLDTTADCVIVDGKVVLRDGRCPGIDEDEVVRECREAAEVLWKKMA